MHTALPWPQEMAGLMDLDEALPWKPLQNLHLGVHFPWRLEAKHKRRMLITALGV